MSGAANLAYLAMSMCRECGLEGTAVQDVADRILVRARRRPKDGRFACLVHSLRMELRRELGVAGRLLPREWGRLQAAGQYEFGRRRYEGFPGRQWPRAFDRHSRRFAIENQVCPRCTRPGAFREGTGECECGFSYGG